MAALPAQLHLEQRHQPRQTCAALPRLAKRHQTNPSPPRAARPHRAVDAKPHPPCVAEPGEAWTTRAKSCAACPAPPPLSTYRTSPAQRGHAMTRNALRYLPDLRCPATPRRAKVTMPAQPRIELRRHDQPHPPCLPNLAQCCRAEPRETSRTRKTERCVAPRHPKQPRSTCRSKPHVAGPTQHGTPRLRRPANPGLAMTRATTSRLPDPAIRTLPGQTLRAHPRLPRSDQPGVAKGTKPAQPNHDKPWSPLSTMPAEPTRAQRMTPR